MQLGAEPSSWGVVLLKELVDNTLDACETAGISPEIAITLRPEGFTVKDNGPGMSLDLIQRSLNYDVRVSDKTYYVSPSRGQLGNALKCVWAAPYAVDPESPGSVEVVSLGLRHRIAVTVDRIAQEPTLAHTLTEEPFVEIGASVTVVAPKVACYYEWDAIEDFYKSVELLIETYAALNPHATFHLQTPDGCLDASATIPDWREWLPSHKTSPCWYEPEHLMALIAAYLSRERAPGGKMKTLREFVSEFDGLSTSAKQKAVLEGASLSRAYLHDLIEGDSLRESDATRLLQAMQAEARPVNPRKLGVLGKAHLLQIMSQRHQIDPQKFLYKHVWGEASGLPYILEVAFGVARQGCHSQERRVLAGINWSATPPPG
jgi:DNA topoisomerase-6 subunit B